ncbi:MAG: SemiSWEET family transporter [Candidatus Kaiserbacteria bacterium]|nr:SemiSWEET family transporter [Candidatus Kaiserbacteria bacterium]
MNGFHHLRARARRTKDLEPFPSPNAWKRLLDYLMYAVGIAAPVALVPQIVQIYTTHDAQGVSFLTWFLLALANILWTLYGVVHKDMHIFFASALMIVFDVIIVVGILLY